MANQDGWRRAGVDLFTVWGPGVRDELVGQGVAASTIAVTGAPWVDRLVTRPASRSRTILVALSGPGHAVGLAEHEGQVEALARACAVTPHYKWVFRLHRKDDAAIYHRAFAAHPDARPEIVPSQRATGTIHDALEDTAVLITVTSASALDAMLCGVPVLTLGRPPHESLPDFVRVGATSHVSDLGGLGVALTALVEQGPSPTLRDAAKAYVEASFGELDGQAAARVAAQMVSLVESLKKNTLQG